MGLLLWRALYVLVLGKQQGFKQTSETVSAKRRITQIITQWVPGTWAGNSKCRRRNPWPIFCTPLKSWIPNWCGEIAFEEQQ